MLPTSSSGDHTPAWLSSGCCCGPVYCAVLERPLQELREELQTDVTEALASYRKHSCSAPASAGQVRLKSRPDPWSISFAHLNLGLGRPPGRHAGLAASPVLQLVLPQHLRALPVYINSLRKSDVLLPGLRTSVHQRLQQRCQVLGMDTLCTSTHFYPLLLPLLRAADPPEAEEPLRCSASSLKPTAVYLVHAPLALLLWVGAQVPADSLVQLFNTSCFFSLSSGEVRCLKVLFVR